MVHWPEAMVAYDSCDKVLFSADAFGSFGALDGYIFNDEVDFDRDWLDDARRYFVNIVGKYGPQVQKLLGKAAGLDIQVLCPLHGPIWRSNLGYILDKYNKWSTYTPEDKGVLIAYASMYGNTENAACILAADLAEKGVKNIVVRDVSNTHVSELIAHAFRLSHMILLSPTYNNCYHPNMEHFITELKNHNLSGRTIALVENGTWAPSAAKHMTDALSGAKNVTILEQPISIKSSIKDIEPLLALSDAVAKSINA
jgi:flavorubredoxin